MSARPVVTSRPVKDPSGFYVLVTWPDASEWQIDDFVTEAEAQAWIDNESEAWVENGMRRKRAKNLPLV